MASSYTNYQIFLDRKPLAWGPLSFSMQLDTDGNKECKIIWNVHTAYHSKKKKRKRKGHNHRENEMTQQNKFIKL